MSVEYKLYTGSSLPEGAALAIKHRLFVPGWTLHPTLEVMRDRRGGHVGELALAIKNDKPVAVAIFDGAMFMAFCREFERYNGYASGCVKLLNKPANAWATEGARGTMAFWDKQGIYVTSRYFPG